MPLPYASKTERPSSTTRLPKASTHMPQAVVEAINTDDILSRIEFVETTRSELLFVVPGLILFDA